MTIAHFFIIKIFAYKAFSVNFRLLNLNIFKIYNSIFLKDFNNIQFHFTDILCKSYC